MSTLLALETELTPRKLVVHPPFSEEELEGFCRANEFWRIERTREGVICMNPPTGMSTTSANSEITGRLFSWWSSHERGEVTDSSGGFNLKDGSMLSPDAAYILPETLKKIKNRRRSGFYPVCPDFVIELLSPTDSLAETQTKMERWIENGASLGWLIDPVRKRVLVYRARPDAEPGAGPDVTAVSGNSVAGDGPVAGFSLDLARLWRYYSARGKS